MGTSPKLHFFSNFTALYVERIYIWLDPYRKNLKRDLEIVFRMHGLLTPHLPGQDHGASLDAASHGLLNEGAAAAASSSTQSNFGGAAAAHQQHHFVHGLVKTIKDQFEAVQEAAPEAKMPSASNLADLKSRLCLREG